MVAPIPGKFEEADVLIVGAGAAGSVLAAKLAQTGKKVLVLEGGPGWRPEDLYNSQIWGRRLRWGGPAVHTAGKDPFGVGFNVGWGFGGSALHHYGCWPRLGVEEFREHSLYGRARDWPIDYATLRPYYDRIQTEVGISGDTEKDVWRPPSAPFPLPALAISPHAEAIARGFAALGLRTAPQPLAINSRPYRGRPACQYDGWCDSGCSILALANPWAVYLPQAQRAGALCLAHSFVERVLLDRRKKRAKGVVFYDRDGRRCVAVGRLIILAAGAIHNARILLNSGQEGHTEGLANRNGLVGRYFTYHSNVSLVAEFSHETMNYLGPVGGTLYSMDDDEKQRAKGLPYGSQMWQIGLSVKPNDILGFANWRPDLIGPPLVEFIEHRSKRMANMAALCQVESRPENRIELAEARDRFGVRLARVVTAMTDNDRALLKQSERQGLNILRAAGAFDAWTVGYGNSHTLGGTVMGSGTEDSVTDSYGFTHEICNLAIAGPGLFPTAGAVNPTFTLHALALRAAEYMVDTWSSRCA
jgi:choline dehydrogenase-like flavoprotein